MNCLIYLRVSTKEQAQTDEKEGYSIPAQREACLRYIRERGFNLVDEYVDRGESARSVDRPQLQEMLSRIKKDLTIDAIVVHKIDRLARNMEDHVAIKAILRRKDVSLISVVENIEDSASGRLVEGIHALMAEFYSSNLAMEVKKGLNQKAKNGGWPGLAPLGYKNERVKIEGREISKIVIDKERAPHIRKAFKLYATGDYSLTELRDILTADGLTGMVTKSYMGKPVSKSKLATLLQNKFYIGVVPWKNMEFKGNHEPLISKNLFEKVQEIIKIHDHAGERKRKHPHYLKGTVYCGECGSRMSYIVAKKQYAYYYCLGQKKHKGCSQKYIAIEDIEKAIEQFYKDIQLPKEWADKIIVNSRKELAERELDILREKEFLNKRISKLNRERQRLLDAYLAEALAVDLLKKEQGRISKDLLESESRLEALSARNDHFEKIVDMSIKMASNCHLAYKKSSPKVKRMLNQAFFKKIYIKDEKASTTEFAEPFDLIFCPSLNKDSLVGATGFEPATTRPPAVCATKLRYAPFFVSR